MARNKDIRFRVSDAEKRRIDSHCASLGIETGRWLRELALVTITEGNPPQRGKVPVVVPPVPELKLSDGLSLGSKRTFKPDPK